MKLNRIAQAIAALAVVCLVGITYHSGARYETLMRPVLALFLMPTLTHSGRGQAHRGNGRSRHRHPHQHAHGLALGPSPDP
jgi:hypothetical protein